MDRPFRMAVRRGVTRELQLRHVQPAAGLVGVLEVLRALQAMQGAGPTLLHQWVQTARTFASWAEIAEALDVSRQAAHERFSRGAGPSGTDTGRSLSFVVEDARVWASDRGFSEPRTDWRAWELRWQRRTSPPRDLIDLIMLRQILTNVGEELTWVVAEARFLDMTWAALGHELGQISRQAVQKRFGAPVSTILNGVAYCACRQPSARRRTSSRPSYPRHLPRQFDSPGWTAVTFPRTQTPIIDAPAPSQTPSGNSEPPP